MSSVVRAALLATLGLLAGPVSGAEILVAVASNFDRPLAQLAAIFEAKSGHNVQRVAGSTGKLYAQIVNGAPYDLFLAADTLRPQRLLASGHAVAGSAVDYAHGALVLWSAAPEARDCLQRLALGRFTHFAIANPALAPYGAAAYDWLQQQDSWEQIESRLVVGESIGQAYHFVASGNAQLGLVAAAQLQGKRAFGCRFLLPAHSHRPIVQQAVLLRRAAPEARGLLAFLASPAAQDLIVSYGYHRRPDTDDGR